MCGICGQIAFSDKEITAGPVSKMTAALQRRGPDAVGLSVQGGTALGHRRLKIIDLSERAQQPMVDSALGLSIVFNGAIYNYKELRSELVQKGYSFFSSGDTEVILKAFHAWGPDCVERFNGMFAFVVVERDSGHAFAARDRLGIKPLYYAVTPKDFRFASALPALVSAGGVDTDIDPVALHHYMTFHSVVPAPRTLLKGVRKLPPASVMSISPDGSIRQQTYWDPAFSPSPEENALTEADWQERVLCSLRDAVSRRLIADVPVGVLLSGGIDSSLVVGLLAELGQNDLNTFSIGFESVHGEAGNEFEYSDMVSRHFDTRHHKIEARSDRVLPALENCIRAMSEPMVSHDCIGFYLLSEVVSRHVKVVQSGQGADEIFGGYHWYPPMLESEKPLDTYKQGFFDRDHAEYADTVHPRLVDADHSLEFVKSHFDRPGAESGADCALRIDTMVMLVDDPVKRVDNMTMAWGLEARVPFLDHELVELAARIPAELKVANGGKHVLKEAARKVVPSAVIDRPKGYFPVPALKYLKGDYLCRVEDLLTSRTSRERAIFNPDYVDRLLAEPTEHLTPLNGSKLWQIALLEWWFHLQNL